MAGNIQRALIWVSERLSDQSETKSKHDLISEASEKFSLSPLETDDITKTLINTKAKRSK